MIKAYQYDPACQKLTFDNLDQIPDGVKNYPLRAQWAWFKTFNNHIIRYFDESLAFKAAQKALSNVMDEIKAKRKMEQKSSFERSVKNETETKGVIYAR